MTDIVTPIEPQPMDTLIITDPVHAPVPYFFATKKGWYANVPTLFGTAHVPADKWPPGLPEVNDSFEYSDELVPRFIFNQALDFFRKVYAAHKTEATTYICRDKTGQYSLFIPTQYVTAASVNHKVDAGEMGDRFPVGTIHSHCDFSAFHSGTDQHDMGKMPGLHATIGLVTRDTPEVAIALAIGNTRWNITAEDIIDEESLLDANGYATAPDHWLNFVKPNESAPWQGRGISTTYGKHHPGSTNLVPFNHGWNGTKWKGAWHDSDYWNEKPTDQEVAQELAEAEDDIATIQLQLAELGYRLQYDIRHDPEMAKSWLSNINRVDAKLWEE